MKTIFFSVLATLLINSLCYSDENWISFDEFKDAQIYEIVIDSQNTKWVKSKKHDSSFYDLFRYDNIEWIEITGDNEIDDYDMQAIAVDKDDILYIGSDRYIYTYDKGDINSYLVPHKTLESGISVPITQNAGVIYVDSNNTKWVAFQGDFHYSAMLITMHNGIFKSIDYMYVNEITSDTQSNIWIVCSDYNNYKGLYMYDGLDFHEYAYLDGHNINMDQIAIDLNNIKWLCSYDIGLLSFIDDSWTLYSKENSGLPSNIINDILVDHNNTKWIATDSGLARFDGEQWSVFTHANSGLTHYKITCLAVEENNTLWIGTEGGLSKYTGDIITAVDEEPKPETLPTVTSYPNPFNPSTTISFTLPESGHANLVIYNLAGQKVRTLMDEPMVSGKHTVVWDGRDDAGNAVAAGVYVTRVTAGESVATGKMVLVK